MFSDCECDRECDCECDFLGFRDGSGVSAGVQKSPGGSEVREAILGEKRSVEMKGKHVGGSGIVKESKSWVSVAEDKKRLK